MNREEKAALIEEIGTEISEAEAIFAIDYRGISVTQSAELRGKLREADASFRVVKNRLTKLAAAKAGVAELDPMLEGPTALTLVKGDTAWTRLRFEGGPHRVQRVPVTEAQGRIHTSSATVMVMPEAEEVEVDIDEKDLNIDVYRASGPGGQGVNTTDSAVRITHIPSGLVVAMQDERSQLQNRLRAMTVLRSRLLKLREDEQAEKMSAERKAQVGKGGRGEKIRTYNFKENRVTDHRIGFTLYQLQDVLAGNVDPVVDALTAQFEIEQLAGAKND